jgi:catechol 2,3-dioxygenase-like lactoylglutathione lyase family enzyme
MRERVPPPLPLQSLSHLSRVVRDTERSIDFYVNVLGFQQVKRPSSFEFEGSW